jgi:hypothetical protein
MTTGRINQVTTLYTLLPSDASSVLDRHSDALGVTCTKLLNESRALLRE